MREEESRVLVIACDDGRVIRLGQGFTTYACISFDVDLRPVDINVGLLRIDSLEASSIIAYSAIIVSHGKPFILFLDSLTIAGFNIISPATITRLAKAPTIVVYNYKPSFNRLYSAFSKLPLVELRMRVLKIVDKARRINTPKGELWILPWEISWEEAKGFIERFQVHSRVPEPLRLAHSIASEASLLFFGSSSLSDL